MLGEKIALRPPIHEGASRLYKGSIKKTLASLTSLSMPSLEAAENPPPLFPELGDVRRDIFV